MRALLGFALLFLTLSEAVEAGVFIYSTNASYFPEVIVHPQTYTGAGGPLTIGVCLDSGAQLAIARDVEYAVRIWNERIAMEGNCWGPCDLAGHNSAPQPYTSYVISTLLHELGHGALGIDHNNWIDGGVHKPFTATFAATNITWGTDQVEGSKDDVVTVQPTAKIVHYFRIDDNNPVVVDSMIIDGSTYTRSRLSLVTSGSNWPASANSRVGNLLGAPNTVSVMQSTEPSNSIVKYLAADDLNQVTYAEKGILPLPASPADDYTYTIQIVPCASAQIEVQYFEFSPVSATLGQSNPAITPLSGGSGFHYRIGTMGSDPRVKVQINSAPAIPQPSPPDIPIQLVYALFLDGFEGGANWSATVP